MLFYGNSASDTCDLMFRPACVPQQQAGRILLAFATSEAVHPNRLGPFSQGICVKHENVSIPILTASKQIGRSSIREGVVHRLPPDMLNGALIEYNSFGRFHRHADGLQEELWKREKDQDTRPGKR